LYNFGTIELKKCPFSTTNPEINFNIFYLINSSVVL
jgi:hypothetical protein